MGRDTRKGQDAITSFGAAQDRADFLSVDLSTNEGVRDAARRVNERTDRIDGLLHSAAVFETRDIRTVDGIPLFVALSYLSRRYRNSGRRADRLIFLHDCSRRILGRNITFHITLLLPQSLNPDRVVTTGEFTGVGRRRIHEVRFLFILDRSSSTCE